MKNIITILSFLILLSCASDDSNNNPNDDGLIINVTGTGSYGAHIAWNTPTGGTSGNHWKFRIVLNNQTVVENLEENSYHFTQLDDATEFSGALFGEDENGNEASGNFSFTTSIDTTCSGAFIFFQSQSEINNNNDQICYWVQMSGEDITDLTPLSNYEYITHLSIVNTSLRSLDGLQNVKAPPGTTYITINIRNNDLLEDISALENLFNDVSEVTIISNERLSNFTGLKQNPNLHSLHIESCPLADISNFNLGLPILNLTLKNLDITHLGGFENGPLLKNLILESCPISDLGDFGDTPLPLANIFLKDLPIVNFSAFRFTPEIKQFVADSLPNITGFSGFDHITKLSYLKVRNNPNLTNLSDLETLMNGNFANQISIEITNNPNLTNFCGIQQWKINNEIMQTGGVYEPQVYHYDVYQNGYNPTEAQMESTTECRL